MMFLVFKRARKFLINYVIDQFSFPRAGQRIVQMYAETAIALFLPELEKGLFDENWRIRLVFRCASASL